MGLEFCSPSVQSSTLLLLLQTTAFSACIAPKMSMRTANLLLAAATLFSGFCLGGQAARAVPRAADPAVLHPINLRSYEAAMGLQRRSGEDFTDLDLSTQSQLIYGRPGGKCNSPVHACI